MFPTFRSYSCDFLIFYPQLRCHLLLITRQLLLIPSQLFLYLTKLLLHHSQILRTIDLNSIVSDLRPRPFYFLNPLHQPLVGYFEALAGESQLVEFVGQHNLTT